jgi:hypothetical protein
MWLCHNDNLDVEVRDENMPLKIVKVIKKEDLDPKMYVVEYGKYSGLNLVQIYSEDPQYIDFLNDTGDILCKQCIKNL